MTHSLSRRHFLGAAAASGAAFTLPRWAGATTDAPLALTATTRTLDIKGRAASVFGIVNRQGGTGLTLDPGQRFRVRLENRLAEETILHWHGQIPPNLQDGVPDMPMPKLKIGEARDYDFPPQPGTHWMHSHVPIQEMRLLAAPLIVRSAEDVAADRQEVVMFLHDFSFAEPEELLAGLPMAGGQDMGAMTEDAQAGHAMGEDANMAGMEGMTGMNSMAGMAMDLNDIAFDAYLANDRTLADPGIVQVEKGGRVKLRIVNGSAATVFWITVGAGNARLVAVDGHPVLPVPGNRFGLAMAQRLDIEVDLPGGEGAFPILAQREGAREQTGIILATAGAAITRVADLADADAPAFDADMAQEMALQAANPLAFRTPDRTEMLLLGGRMTPYVWTISGKTWADHIPVTAKTGDRVEIMFHNMSMMAHPMHLHGHAFQVVGVGSKRLNGAVRDTVMVPPMAKVTIAIDAGEAARWMLHCHHMPHLATGMMTEFAVSA